MSQFSGYRPRPSVAFCTLIGLVGTTALFSRFQYETTAGVMSPAQQAEVTSMAKLARGRSSGEIDNMSERASVNGGSCSA
jgi:hypothetical protein